MLQLFEANGLIFWEEKEINLRNSFEQIIKTELLESLLKQNSAFKMIKIEAPIITPGIYINKNYTVDDVYTIGGFGLRPETTIGSYLYVEHLLNSHNDIKYKLPLIVYQHGKSFRREQDQVVKNMRLKEFYQLEFQIVYSETTQNDYSKLVIPAICDCIEKLIGKCYTTDSERIPSYADWTKDIVFEKNEMEVCSISQRHDLENYKVLEVAIGTDRLLYNYNQKEA
jgi:glycyl-tRNA synthetase